MMGLLTQIAAIALQNDPRALLLLDEGTSSLDRKFHPEKNDLPASGLT